MKLFSTVLLGCTIFGLLVSACTIQPTPVPTVELLTPAATRPPASVTATTTFQPSITPRPTATAARISTVISATGTPILTPFPTTDSSLPLSESGPWLAFLAWRGGFENEYGTAAVVNADGNGRRQLASNVWSITASSASPYLAVLIQPPEFQGIYIGASVLEVIHLPEMSSKTIPLISSPAIDTFDYSQIKPGDIPDKQSAIHLITWAVSYKKPAWSSDGRYLAFTAAIDGPTADLYVYDTLSDQIRRLSDGLEMATQPEWSPDGQWIVHRGLYAFGAGCTESGVWAAAVDGSQVKWLNPGECFTITQWTGPETFETFTPPSGGGAPDNYVGPVKRVDIAAGTSTLLYMKPGSPNALPVVDCLSLKPVGTPGIDYTYNCARSDAPDGKWFVVSDDRLRLFTADGKLVDEFNELDQFDGWQPDSGAIVFTTQGSHPDRRMIHYYQPADRTLKTYENILPPAGGFPDRVIWSNVSSSFFLVVSSSQGLDAIDPLKDQFLQVDRPIGEIYNTDFAWVGGEK